MKTHWKKLTNPDYLGAYALEDGRDVVLTISHVREEQVIGTDGKKENCPVCYFAERGVKPMILNSTNMKTITKLFGTPYIEDWAGRKIQIGVEKVKAFGEVVEALRVRKFAPKEAQTAPKCSGCGCDIQGRGKMSADDLATYTKQKYGQALCSACATKLAEQAKFTEAPNETIDE